MILIDPSKYPYCASAQSYVAGVLDGSILACEWIRLACERHQRDLARIEQPDWLYTYDFDLAEKAARFASRFPHVKGRWAAKHELFKPEPWQCFWYCSIFGWINKETGKRRFRKARGYISRKNGKALRVDTPIATSEGWKLHGDLRVGDLVFAPDGRPVRVEAVGEHHLGPCRTMQFSDGAKVIAHDRHEWMTERKWFTGRKMVGFRWGEKIGPLPPVESQRIAATLRGGARGDLVHSVPVPSPLQMPERELRVDPYVLGAWLGDGHSATANLTSENDEIPAFIRAQGYPCRKLGGRYLYSLSAGRGDGSLTRDLRALGVLGNKHIPVEYLRASIPQRTALLQALIDTDGTVSKAGQVTFCNTNRRLAEGVAELVRSLGMKAQWTEKRAMLNGRDCGERYDVQFWANEGLEIARLPRKQSRVRNSSGRARTRMITGAEEAGVHTVNCIQVEGGLYLAGREMVTTHNSLMAAPIGLYMLTADNEPGAEVFSGATNEKQAWEVFGPAKQMATLRPDFRERFGVQVNAKSLTVPGSMAKFEPVIGKPGDGSSPHCSITDEYHEHITDEQLATMETGMGAREQPLSIVVSTAGDNMAGPCRADWLECQKVLQGTQDDETLFCLVFTIDKDDDWTSESALRKANPNFGISVSAEFLLAQQRDAINNPRKQGHFKTKHLNIWVQARDAFIDLLKWRAGADPSLRLEDFYGRTCYLGMDLASKVDLCALELLFPEPDGTFVRFGKYYLPRATVDLPQNEHYREYEALGLLTVTDGNITSYNEIEEDILALAKVVDLVDIGYDPHEATMLATRLIDEGLPMVEFAANMRNFNEPMKQVEALILNGQIRHDGDKVMEWAMSNVVAKVDRGDRMYPYKETNDKKIDPFVALCMAMGRYLAGGEKPDDWSGFLSSPVVA